ncbi:MAG TPA: hypothetical protein PKM84_00950 [Candidatus Pacearchaeota archaeon]|nr:hypothetical protein [Candidatus Pacearchaeota archaeon]
MMRKISIKWEKAILAALSLPLVWILMYFYFRSLDCGIEGSGCAYWLLLAAVLLIGFYLSTILIWFVWYKY